MRKRPEYELSETELAKPAAQFPRTSLRVLRVIMLNGTADADLAQPRAKRLSTLLL